MGHLYKDVELYLDQLTPTDTSVFVEIGSDKGNGSTLPLAGMAQSKGLRLITVDLEEGIEGRLQYRYPDDPRLTNIDCVCAQGSVWAKDLFPSLGLSIACLYLDNFDWDYGDPQWNQTIIEQRQEYAKRGFEMTNYNSQIEHLAQMVALLPYMDDTSIITCDDTYTSGYNCWVGKCGAVVPYLRIHGYNIIRKDESAVMLARNIRG